jgi:hypothetical protein
MKDLIIGCPLLVRSDHGTENCSLAALHIALNNNDKCFIYGPSKHNIVSDVVCYFKIASLIMIAEN